MSVASYRLWVGDARAELAQLPAKSVQCIITSPPYWGLRSYLPTGHADKSREVGAESTPAAYVAQLVAVFREARRVLKDDGLLFLNIDDAYSRGNRATNPQDAQRGGGSRHQRITVASGYGGGGIAGRPAKNLLGLPWHVALALQDDGWILRSDILWVQPNPSPESVLDRPTRSHEYVFMFAKSSRPQFWVHAERPYTDQVRQKPLPDWVWVHRETGQMRRDDPHDPDQWRRKNLWRACDYYYDAAAIAEPAIAGDNGSYFDRGKTAVAHPGRQPDTRDKREPGLRNKRDVWTIATAGASSPDAHFAVFPEKLVEPMILAGSRPGDVILDPFAGSGTTLAVANRLGRIAWGIELNPTYAELIHHRLAGQLTWVI